MRFAIPLVLACGFAVPALAQSGRPPALLIHGNYCGPGNNAPLPPIDALDAACARHDACTPRGGLASAACNARLQREATLISRDPRQPRDLRDAAGFVAFAAGMMPARSQMAAAPHIRVPSIETPSIEVPSIDVPATGSVAPSIGEDDDE
ncbi:hypothetical protein [Methylobacterium sp. SyP6R]|uniref:hypothetical protein n=1 Tax=Methylobacterium sp. SyP6R TaxID=2718876 RepID=UPI001F406B7A|nr:hypothetical protein [Methylobacterium sp. SyP6R]MCF4123947.1 hypothetical protein [Methylobacterium sp. SyP6R]